MKALPKHCLLHHAVLLLVYLSALFLTSRAANLPNLFYMAFNGLVLGLSAAYLRRDFDTDLFKLKRTAANVVRQVLTGLGLGRRHAVRGHFAVSPAGHTECRRLHPGADDRCIG